MEASHRDQPEGGGHEAWQDQGERGCPEQGQNGRDQVRPDDLRACDGSGLAQLARPHGERALHQPRRHEEVFAGKEQDQGQQHHVAAPEEQKNADQRLQDEQAKAPAPE